MKKEEIIQSIKIITLSLILSFGINFVSAQITPPAGAPGSYNVLGPLNTGSSSQSKDGELKFFLVTPVFNFNITTGDALIASLNLNFNFSHYVEDLSSSGIKTDGLSTDNLVINPLANASGGDRPLCVEADGTLGICAPSSNVVVPHGSQVFTSSGTFTVPSGVTQVVVTAVGGGGGGGGGKRFANGSQINVLNYDIEGTGGTGGNTLFNNLVVANGGNGGTGAWGHPTGANGHYCVYGTDGDGGTTGSGKTSPTIFTPNGNGGNGGNPNNGGCYGGGGGSGLSTTGTIIPVSSGAVIPVTIGSGGSGGASTDPAVDPYPGSSGNGGYLKVQW